jgi:outer membrane protein OmpA-like peptidoglycan-associated protein
VITTAERVPAAAPPVNTVSARPYVQRCGGVQCPPGSCDHDEGETVQRAVSRHHFARFAVRPSVLQPALALGPPGDRYEQEADRVAELVAGSHDHDEPAALASHQISQVQRACAGSERAVAASQTEEEVDEQDAVLVSSAAVAQEPVSPAVQRQIAGMRGGGQPLLESVRAYFEPRFGHDFRAVRIHTGQTAADAVQSLGARAFTVGTDLAFAPGQYAPETGAGRRLLAHELTHVVQQGGAAPVADTIQRAGAPAMIPPGLSCPTDLTATAPTGTDLLFPVGGIAITPPHTAALTTFVTAWVTGGGTDDVIVHGYASTVGTDPDNWTLSCRRAEAVRAELIRLGIPAVRASVLAHGETSEFSASPDPNQRVVVLSRPAGVISLPVVIGALTAQDNFAGRSATRFGVGEIIDLNFLSFPAAGAAALGGLEWHLVSGGGTLAGITPAGTATYTAPPVAAAVTLELRVAAGATAGRVISTHAITIVTPDSVSITAIPGTAPGTSPLGGVIPAGTWGAGFLGNVFVGPKDVSFQGVTFGEGTIPGVVTPAGSFLRGFAGMPHPPDTFGRAHGGNSVTGTAVSPPPDQIAFSGGPVRTVLGVRFCGASDFLWAIPWEFSVGGGPRTPFATANQHATSTLFCDATVEKGGAGPFCRTIDGATC